MITQTGIKRRRGHRATGGVALALCLAGGIGLSGCGEARQAFGLERNVPDEFAVVSRAPLSLPPDYNLRPPQPGAPRPQEPTTRQAAQRVVLASAQSQAEPLSPRPTRGVSSGESVILARAGTDMADPGIRRTVDEETASLMRADESFVDSLLFWQAPPPPGTVVDPRLEAQRLATNAATGVPLNEGDVPTIERRDREPLEGVFDGLFDF